MTLVKAVLSQIALLFSCCLFSAQAAVIYVNQLATGNNTGLNWRDAYADLQLALSAATAGESIRLQLQGSGPGLRAIRVLDLRKKILREMVRPHHLATIVLPVPGISGLYVLELVDL